MPKHECPKCHKRDRLTKTRTTVTLLDMDEDGYTHVCDYGDVISDKITSFGCRCGWEGTIEDLVKEERI